MCNLYRPPPPDKIATMFGVEPPSLPYGNSVGPLNRGPYLTPDGMHVGQWGMIPPGSSTAIPTRKDGGRMSTNNARIERIKSAWTFRGAWHAGRRCLIPAQNFDEPNWESGKNVWWTLAQASGEPWALAGLYDFWTDPQTGEVVHNYTMLTQNCDGHTLLARLHKPDPKLPADAQDKRTVVAIAPEDWDTWLNGTKEMAMALIRVWPEEAFAAGPRNMQLR